MIVLVYRAWGVAQQDMLYGAAWHVQQGRRGAGRHHAPALMDRLASLFPSPYVFPGPDYEPRDGYLQLLKQQLLVSSQCQH